MQRVVTAVLRLHEVVSAAYDLRDLLQIGKKFSEMRLLPLQLIRIQKVGFNNDGGVSVVKFLIQVHQIRF